MRKTEIQAPVKARVNWITRLVDVVKLIKKGPVPVNLYLAPQTWFDLALLANDRKTTIGGVISQLLNDCHDLGEQANDLRNLPD